MGRSFLLMSYGLGFLNSLLKFGSVIFAYGGKTVWSKTFYLRFPLVQKLDVVFSAYGSPTVRKMTNRKLIGIETKSPQL